MRRTLLAVALVLCSAKVVARECPVPLDPTRTGFTTVVEIGTERSLRFLVDTGSTMTVIDRAVAHRLGLKSAESIRAVSSTGAVEVQEAIVDELRAGSVVIKQMNVLIADLPRFVNHGHVDGLLGMNFFAGHAVLFDVRNRCLELDTASRGRVTLSAHEAVGRVAFEIEGLTFILDSGASFAVLKSSHARALAQSEGTIEMTSAAGGRRVATGTIPVLHVGTMAIHNVPAVLVPVEDRREDGLLPLTAFQSVYIAADRKQVIIE
jgi:predicted aspartyl protease